MVLSNARITAVVAVTDMKQAKDFYGKTLGLKPANAATPEAGNAVFQGAGDTHLYVYERPTPAQSTATVVSFEVDDVTATVADLRSKGVRFEEYDLPEMGIKTVDGVAEIDDFKAAWFKDPSGNILSIGSGMHAATRSGGAVAKART